MSEEPTAPGSYTPAKEHTPKTLTLEERFLRYKATGGKLPFSTYEGVIALVEREEPIPLGEPTKAQAVHYARVAKITEESDLLPKVISIYGVLRENTQNVLGPDSPKSPKPKRPPKNRPTQWCDQEVFAEALLIAGLTDKHQAYVLRFPNIFGIPEEQAGRSGFSIKG